MEFALDFSLIDLSALRSQHIRLSEVSSVLKSPTSVLHPQKGFDYLIGFSDQKKFIHIAFRVSGSPKFDLQILQVELPYENDI
ncbi:MAG: hypothetical protein K2U26_06115, partial [Cyclobacteriaceae bacterium]|nr:hypothetical protein [Cyclobacteriaceae bacterium]